MFIGHYGLGFAAKKINNRPSLGTLFMATQFIDLLWPIFLIFGVEQVKIEQSNNPFTNLNFIYYPFSHSLFGVVIWALLFGIIYYLIKKDLRSSLILGGLVVSHWFLDLLTHVPDLPLVPWSDLKVGFGLWNSVPFTILVELLIFVLGAFLYIKTTKAKNKKGSLGLWSLIVFFIIIYFMNLVSPPPPSVDAIGYAGLLLWLFVIWAYWIDKNRMYITE